MLVGIGKRLDKKRHCRPAQCDECIEGCVTGPPRGVFETCDEEPDILDIPWMSQCRIVLSLVSISPDSSSMAHAARCSGPESGINGIRDLCGLPGYI